MWVSNISNVSSGFSIDMHKQKLIIHDHTLYFLNIRYNQAYIVKSIGL